jgi:DNA-binding MarR family transcriptional regulator
MAQEFGVDDPDVEAIEAAMVAIRRRSNRRTIAGAPNSADEHARIGVQPVLDAVEEAAGAATDATVTTVAALLGLDQSRASKMVAAAIDMGLLRREADQADGRRSLLRLTAAGMDQLRQVHEVRQRTFARAMAEWSPRQRNQFARLLTRFVADLQRTRQD